MHFAYIYFYSTIKCATLLRCVHVHAHGGIQPRHSRELLHCSVTGVISPLTQTELMPSCSHELGRLQAILQSPMSVFLHVPASIPLFVCIATWMLLQGFLPTVFLHAPASIPFFEWLHGCYNRDLPLLSVHFGTITIRNSRGRSMCVSVHYPLNL